MAVTECLCLEFKYPLEAINAGLFVSTGQGTHATRTLDSFELLFVNRGQIELFEDDRVFCVEKNNALLLWPGRKHGGLRPFEPGLTFYWVHFRLREEISNVANSSIRVPQLTRVLQPERLTELFLRFLDDQETDNFSPLAASHLIMLMLYELIVSAETAERAEHTETLLAERIHAYIAAHFHESICTSEVAKSFKYNADYLERVYRREKQISITEAIHHRRIKEARAQLLLQNQMNINEIAFACGYRDPGYFRRMFKRVTTMTPKMYRALYTRTHINNH